MFELFSILRRARTGRYRVQGDPAQARWLLGFSFGIGPGGTPGASNEALAQFAFGRFRLLPKVLQIEVAQAYEALDPGGVGKVFARHRRPKKHFDTREVAWQAREFLREQGPDWRDVIVLAHPHHMPRAVATCRRLGMRPIAPPGLETIPFDPESEQVWTRDQERWYRREVKAALWYQLRWWI
jgi:hypothetical protein